MSFKDHFSNIAENYQRYRPTYPSELFAYLASLCQEHQLAWDCATGNGQAAKSLAQYFDHVVATDASKEQIVAAEQIDKVKFLCEPAEQTHFKDHSVDLITVAQALHWFDLPKFYQEVNRVLKPGSVFAAWCYSVFRCEDKAINQLVKKLYLDVTGPYWPPERQQIDDGYEKILFPYSRLSAPAFAIEREWSSEDLLGYLSTWSGLQRCCAAGHEAEVEQVFAEIVHAWPKDNSRVKFSWPIHLLLTKMPNVIDGVS